MCIRDRRDAARRKAIAAGDDRNGAAFKRAEAQISGILAQRVAEQLRLPGRAAKRDETLRAVAAHQIDPFSAADDLLGLLAERPTD